MGDVVQSDMGILSPNQLPLRAVRGWEGQTERPVLIPALVTAHGPPVPLTWRAVLPLSG